MSAKHFRAIAATFAASRPADNTSAAYLVWASLAASIEHVCASDNPRFDRDRFNAACLASA